MIDAKDLRIGNWVTYDPDAVDEGTKLIPLQIEVIDSQEEIVRLSDGFDNTYGFGEILPIPLTPDILEKCGFEEGATRLVDTPNLEAANQPAYLNYDYMEREIGIYIDSRRIGQEHSEYWIKCEYLHQLQNLYYALTNSELLINL